MAKKLWNVTVTCEINMPVAAETREEAESIAEANFTEEPSWEGSVTSDADEVLCAADMPKSFEGALPWGGDSDTDGNEFTCEETIARSKR